MSESLSDKRNVYHEITNGEKHELTAHYSEKDVREAVKKLFEIDLNCGGGQCCAGVELQEHLIKIFGDKLT